MHAQAMDFCRRLRDAAPAYFNGVRCLEVGSFDVNGSARPLFTNSVFVGVDVRPGPNVDIVCDAASLRFKDHEFDVAFATEVFEHSAGYTRILKQMFRVVKPGGLVFATAANENRTPHGCDGGPLIQGEFYAPVSMWALNAAARGHRLMSEEDCIAGDIRAAWRV